MINESIAKVLVELRNQKNISQEKLAAAIDSHQVYISEIEKGKKQPSVTVLYNIAKYYDISLSKLFAEIDKEISKQSEKNDTCNDQLSKTKR